MSDKNLLNNNPVVPPANGIGANDHQTLETASAEARTTNHVLQIIKVRRYPPDPDPRKFNEEI